MKLRNRPLIWISLILLTIVSFAPVLFSCNYTTAKEDVVNFSNQAAPFNSEVSQLGNNPPVINKIIPEWSSVARGETTKIKISAYDQDGDSLTYSWRCKRV